MYSKPQLLVPPSREQSFPNLRGRNGAQEKSQSSWSVVVVEDEAGLAPHVPAWDELASAALEPNPFYEPWMFLPALRSYRTGLSLRIVLVFSADPALPEEPPRLGGFFPLEFRSSYKRLPVPFLRTWLYLHCFLGVPLVRADKAEECLATFFDFLGRDHRGAGLVEFRDAPGEGPWHDLLVGHWQTFGRGVFVSDRFRRALLVPEKDAATYLSSGLGHTTKRALKRHQKALARIGRVDYVPLEVGDKVETWIEKFLALEAAGWKGRAGTALDCSEKDRSFFVAVMKEAYRRGRLIMLALHLNGRPIAVRCTFLAGLGAFSFKTTFDENYATCSPGFLLEIETIRQLHGLSSLRWMDSCAAPDNAQMNRLWRDRKIIQTVTVTTGRKLGSLVVAVLPFLFWLRGKVCRPVSSSPSNPQVPKGPTMLPNQLIASPPLSHSSVEKSMPAPMLKIDPATFPQRFNRKPFLLDHNLKDHPLFSLPRLIELAKRLPEKFVDYNAGNIPISIDSRLTPRNGLSIEETIRRIEDHCSWMVIKRVEQDPEYNEFLDRCLDEIQAYTEPLDPGMFDRAGAIFISSPASVTPYHIDEEYNFLFQMRGTKFLSVFDQSDRSLLTHQELEEYFSGTGIHRNLVFRDEYQQKGTVFELSPGKVLHVPSLAPHWVKNGSEVSISFSAGFLTKKTKRMHMVYQLNHSLRNLGLHPIPYGDSAVRDFCKYNGGRVYRRLKRVFSRGGDKPACQCGH